MGKMHLISFLQQNYKFHYTYTFTDFLLSRYLFYQRPFSLPKVKRLVLHFAARQYKKSRKTFLRNAFAYCYSFYRNFSSHYQMIKDIVLFGNRKKIRKCRTNFRNVISQNAKIYKFWFYLVFFLFARNIFDGFPEYRNFAHNYTFNFFLGSKKVFPLAILYRNFFKIFKYLQRGFLAVQCDLIVTRQVVSAMIERDFLMFFNAPFKRRYAFRA